MFEKKNQIKSYLSVVSEASSCLAESGTGRDAVGMATERAAPRPAADPRAPSPAMGSTSRGSSPPGDRWTSPCPH